MKDSTIGRLFLAGTRLFLVLAVASVSVLPNVGRGASGNIYMITSNPEYEADTRGFAGFLRSLGYTVDVGAGSCDPYLALNAETPAVQAAKIAQLEAYNLIIIHRNFGSGTLNSDNATGVERGIWNKMKVPILLCNGPIVRNNIWRWYNTLYGNTISKDILLETPANHPIVASLTGSLFNNDRFYGGLSSAFGGVAEDGGTNMAILARVNFPGFGNPICMAVWDEAPGGTEERGFYDGSGETYYRRRVYFEMHEYRNNALNPDPWLEVTANGRLLFADAVQYAMYGVVTPPPFVDNLTPADQTANYDHTGGVSFDASSPLPISDANISVKLNGSNIAGGLVFSGPNTNRHVSYTGLISNFLYNLEITVSNVTGPRTVFAQFDTFVPGQTFTMTTPDGINYSDFPPAGDYHAYLRVASASAKELSLYLGTSASDPLLSVFYVPATASMATFAYAPLTDALGELNILRFNGSSYTFFLDPVDNVTTIPGDLVFVPAANVPAILRPIVARARPIPNSPNVSPLAALTIDLANRDTSVQNGTVHLKLAGNDVTSLASIIYNLDNVSITYQPTAFLKPGSNYVAQVSYTDGTAMSTTNNYSFVIRDMPVIPAAYKTSLGTGTDRGFNIRNHMARNQGGVAFCATADRAELQLEGLFLSPGGQPITNAINNTPFAESFINETVINYGIATGGTKGWFADDELFPGSNIVGPTNVAFEATTFLELKAGINRYGVRSSDGFRLTAGSALAKNKQTVLIGSFDGARGEQNPSEGAFLVYEDGLYAFRLLYHKGGNSDVSLEWYSRTNDVEFVNDPFAVGDRTLINGMDTGGETPTPAYRSRTTEPTGPALTATRVGNAVEISWTSSADYQLQFKTDLSAPMWLPVSQTPVVNGNLQTVSISNPSGTVFYRLQSQ